VVKRKIAKKYPNFLEAFNSGTLAYNDNALSELLNGLGISFATSDFKDKMKDIELYNEFNLNYISNNEREIEELKRSNFYLNLILQEKSNEIKKWEDEEFIYVKKGTKTKRYPKE